MKIRLLSDIHTEFRVPYKTELFSKYCGEDVLVLAGDIAVGSKAVLEVIEHFYKLGFPNIVYVTGNHEYYGNDFDQVNLEIQAGVNKLPGVYFLNNSSVIINEVLFVGGTLWTNFRDRPLSELTARGMIADFSRIRKGALKFTTHDAQQEFYKSFAYIKHAYEHRGDLPLVVVTHFLPTSDCISPRWKADQSGLNDYFANDLGSWIENLENTTWLFGHTHDACDFVTGTTRLVCNPHGYYTSLNDGLGFDPLKTIEI